MNIAGNLRMCPVVASFISIIFALSATAQNSPQPVYVSPDSANVGPIQRTDVPSPEKIEPPTPTTQIGNAWISLGPSPTVSGQLNVPPSNQVCGAIQAIAAHPTNPDILYIGAVNGGIWRTANATATTPIWTPLSDSQVSLSIGALEFDATDSTRQTLVAGSARLSSFGAVGGARIGVLRTTDGGNNWSVLGTTTFANENLTSVAARSNVLMAASDSTWGGGSGSGIFRSTNTGASFTLVSGAGGTGLPAGPVSDLVADPVNLNRFYAAVRTVGIYRSDDAGVTWTNVTGTISGITAATTKIEMAVHNNGGTSAVYVAVLNSSALAGMWRSADFGATWTQMDTPGTGGQGDVHFSIVADPSNSSFVYVGGQAGHFRGNATLSLGSQFVSINGSGGGNTTPHADSREMVFDANGNIIEGDDGGIYRRLSPQSSSGVWVSVVGTLGVMEAHDVSYDSVAHVAMIGTQDNGTHIMQASNSTVWLWISGGDGGDVAIDDKSTPGQSVRYGSSQNLAGFYRKTYNAANTLLSTVSPVLTVLGGGAAISSQFATPVELNKVNPVRLIIGGANSAYESLDRGDSVTALADGFGVNGTFTAKPIAYGGWLAGMPNPDVLYYGSGSSVRVRTTAGGAVTASAGVFPGSTVQDIVMDANNWLHVFAIDSSGVYYSTNAGTNWINVTGNLTGVGALHTLEFFALAGVDCVAVGTDLGVFCASVNDPGNWSRLGSGLPNVPVYDLTFSAADHVLVAGTMGRGVFALNLAEGLSGLRIADATVTEGDAGTTDAVFTVTLTPAFTNTVIVGYATADGTALAGSDYIATNGTLTFLPGETNETVTVTVLGDTLAEADETIYINLSVPTNAFSSDGSAVGLIVNDDAPPSLSIAGTLVLEGNTGTTDAVFSVTLSALSGATVTTTYTTGNGSAVEGSDFMATNATVSLPPGITSTNVVVRVLGDVAVEPDETFTVTLSAPVNATLGTSSAVGTIQNDDGLPGQIDHFAWSPITSPQYAGQPFGVVISALDYFNAPATNLTGPASLNSGVLNAPATVFQTNSTYITIPDLGVGTPYPSTINVSNLASPVTKVTVKLKNMSHTYLDDVDVLLVGPGGQKVMLKGSGGGVNPGVGGATFTFDDGAATAFPSSSIPPSGTYRPANYNAGTFSLPSPAPAAPYVTNLSVFNGYSPNGAWQLFVNDQASGDFGNIAAGWELALTVSGQTSPSISPTITGTFTNGVWAGAISVLQLATNVFLQAADISGHTNISGTFNVLVADDLSLVLSGTPSTILAGNILTYNLTIANSGPNTATGVLLTNLLPPSVANAIVTPSQGTSTVMGNVVACDLGTLNSGSNATVTISVTPLLAGSITNQASVYRNGPDGNSSNNLAGVVTVVTVPSLTISNASVTEGNSGTTNMAFTVALTPTPALPVNVQFATASLSATAGVDYLSANGLLTFVAGQSNRTILVQVIGDADYETNETFQVTLSNATNATIASGTAVGTILDDDAPPHIVAAGYTVVADACNNNGYVDPGELVTLAFALRNAGATAGASNLVATLMPTSAVLAPSGPYVYGMLLPGVTKTNPFTFRANALCGTQMTATLQLQDGTNELGLVAFTVPIGATTTNVLTFSNSTAISILDSGAGSPYPSSINVSNVTGAIQKVTARLKSLNHTYPDDLDILLVGPGGQNVMLMSDAGGSFDAVGITLTFDDTAASVLPDSAQITSGTYRPTDYLSGDVLASPAPVGPYGTNLFVFTNSSPNGTWQLFVFDDTASDMGSIASGWELTMTVTGAGGDCCQSPLQFVGAAFNTNGTFQLSAYVSPNQNYQIQASTNLMDWTSITNVLSPTSPVIITDPNAGLYPYRFYRALFP